MILAVGPRTLAALAGSSVFRHLCLYSVRVATAQTLRARRPLPSASDVAEVTAAAARLCCRPLCRPLPSYGRCRLW